MSTPINDALVASQATRRSDRSGAPDTRLRGRKLILARVVWVAAVTLIVALYLAILPAKYTTLQADCTAVLCVNTMQRLGLSVGAYATFTLALDIALAFLCFTLGAVIFWRKSDDWMALLVGMAVVATVILNDYASYSGTMLTFYLYILGTGVYVLVFSLFPDGRFVPRWMRWLLLCWLVAALLSMYLDYNLVWHAELVLLVIAQVYRHRTAASPLQRQQGKWLLFGACVGVIIIVGLTLLPLIIPALGQAGSFYLFVIIPAYLVISFTLPLCIGLAILRYRLYDIDIIIHRTLVYSVLTVLLATVYEVSVFTLQSLTSGLTFIRGNQLAIVASTFLIGGLFKPLHDRIRAVIDRRFYRRKYDAARTVAAFSATIRDEVDLNQLGIKLMAVVQETMQPAHVSLWLCPPKRYGEKTTRALPLIDVESEP
jgi:hypothetical protein